MKGLISTFTFVIEQEGNSYSSFFPELDIASCGKTYEEAEKNIREAIELYLEYLIDNEK